MTVVKETRHIFDLGDIKAIRLKCTNCKREAVQSVKTTEVLKQCPFCKTEWEVDLPQGARGLNYHLVRNMQELLKQENLPMTIHFELDGDSAGKTG